MKSRSSMRRGEAGQILIYEVLTIAVAAIIPVPLLSFTYASHRSADIRGERLREAYAADAGVEDALYQIKHAGEMEGIEELTYEVGQSYDPDTPAPWNDSSMDVLVEKVCIPGDLGYPAPAEASDEVLVQGMLPGVDNALRI